MHVTKLNSNYRILLPVSST